jgi:hypothetical protein
VEPDPRTRLAAAIDLRLSDLYAQLFEVPPERWDVDLVAWFLRAAYGQGYSDALCESEAGALCRELGLRPPARAA